MARAKGTSFSLRQSVVRRQSASYSASVMPEAGSKGSPRQSSFATCWVMVEPPCPSSGPRPSARLIRTAEAMPRGEMPRWRWKRRSSVATIACVSAGATALAVIVPPNCSPRQANTSPWRSSRVTDPRARPSSSAPTGGSVA